MRAAALALVLFCSTALAFQGEVRIAELPPEARATLARIQAGGPFP
jgi:guanyl-specific ribonuclease Sa